MPAPLLCVTVTAPTMAELRQRRDAVTGADLVELRLDSVSDPSAAGALEGRRCPVIVTCRPRWEGGHFAGSEGERRQILNEALDRGADYVDIEFRAGFDDLIRAHGGRRIVLSLHDFDGVPRALNDRVRAMRMQGTDVIKVAVLARGLSDCLPLLQIEGRGNRYPATTLLAMGAAGLPTRILAAHFGSCWTYAGDAHAVGQISPERMLGEFDFRRISLGTDIYGIVGSPLTHTVSPAMHNAAFRAAGVNAVYVPLAAAGADDFMTFARALRVKGASVTIPFKMDLFDRVDEADAVSRRVGAINTVRFTGRRCLGTNTDVYGFLKPLDGRIDLTRTRAAILGAGGAARAVAVGLASAGASVAVYARDPRRAESVARLVGGQAGTMPPPAGSWDVLINATPLGTFPRTDETPFEHAVFDGRLVYDLVYNPLRTRFLSEAAAAGCATIGGLEMLVAQADQQSEWWIGHRPPARLMRDAALAALSQPEEAV
jgi:3-dehydroquinate dehydratase / shikimate dehydrogenase